jgi:hypothetical protein
MNVRILYYLLLASGLCIPVMWLLGHRGNNALLLFFILFGVSLIASPPFNETIGRAIRKICSDRLRIMICLLISGALIFAIMSLLLSGQSNFWNLDREDGVGTLYSGMLLAANALILTYCAREVAGKKARFRWTAMSIFFAIMAIDELSEFHHWLPQRIWQSVSGKGTEPIIEGVTLWITLLAPVIFVVIIVLCAFILRCLSGRSRRTAFLGLALWVLSQAFEATIESQIINHVWEITIEEFLEMSGSILFLVAFLMEYTVLIARKATARAAIKNTDNPGAYVRGTTGK